MPSHVRIFFWIIAAVVTYWILSAVWNMASHPIRHINNYRLFFAVTVSAIIGWLTPLILAWLAAFRRLNWARWAVLIFFVWKETWPLIFIGAYYQRSAFVAVMARPMLNIYLHPSL